MLRRFKNALLVIGIFLSTSQAAAISGTVSDSASGTKIGNVSVQLRSGYQPLATDTTDDQGAFTFSSVDSGGYSIRTTITGYTQKTTTINVTQTDTMINITMAAIVTSTISGKITDSASGEALSGAIVSLDGGMGASTQRDTTDANGLYSFSNVAVGTTAKTLSVSMTGYNSKNSVSVSVASSTPVTKDIALVKAIVSTVSGKITDSASGEALSGAVVSLGGGTGASTQRDTTDADGLYSFSNVTVGTTAKILSVSLTGYNAKNNVAVNVADTTPVTKDVALVKTVYSSITGKITDSASGDALLGAVVTLSNRRDTTGADGLYSFDSITTGNKSINVSMTGYNPKNNISVTVADSTPVTKDVALVKIIYSSISGKVTDSASGEALSGVVVSLGTGGFGGSTKRDTTDANGAYSFDSVASVTLTASMTGYNGKSVTVTVTSNTPVTQDIALSKIVYTTVSGKITDSISGAALSGVVVSLGTGGFGGSTKRDTTDANGAYSFDSVAGGNQSIRVTKTGYQTKTTTVTVSGSDPVTSDISMRPTPQAIIYGLAIRNNGIPGFNVSSGGIMTLSNISSAGELEIFNLNGKLIYKYSFNRPGALITLSQKLHLRGSALFVKLSTGGKEFKNRISPLSE